MKTFRQAAFLLFVFTGCVAWFGSAANAVFAEDRDLAHLVLPDSSQELADRFAVWVNDFAADDMEVRKKAQQGWQAVCRAATAPGMESRRNEVNRLMIEQLDGDLDPVAEAWIYRQLYLTATDSEIPAVAARLAADDSQVRNGAIRVLAAIRSQAARQALKDALSTLPEEYRPAVEQALRTLDVDFSIPVESVSPQNLPYIDEAAVDAFVADYDSLDSTQKARTIAALTVRGDQKFRPLIDKALADSDADVRRNGLLALEKLGTANDLPVLIAAFDAGDEALARTILSRINDPAMDAALLNELQKTDDSRRFLLIADVLSDRDAAEAFGAILDGAKRWPALRAELVQRAERVATRANIGPILDLMVSISDVKAREQVERSVMRLCCGDATPVAQSVTPENLLILLPCLGRIGGEAAWGVVHEALESGDVSRREAAVKALANWPNAERYAELWTLANDTTISPAGRIAALRGTIRVITLPPEELGITLDDSVRLELLQRCFAAAERAEDRQLALERAGAIRTLESLHFVMGQIQVPELSKQALQSALELAHHDFLRKAHPAEFQAALEKILAVSNNPNMTDRARKYLDQMNGGSQKRF